MGLTPEQMRNIREHMGSCCDDCDTILEPKVMQSTAGFYVGTSCKCGPYSRESLYYGTEAEAQEVLNSG
jgi:hypothetical protein